MNKFTTLILTAAFAAASQGALAAASNPTASAPAQVEENSKHLTVRFADLDLTRPQGAAQLYHRLHKAAEVVCSSLESRELSRMALFNKCVAETMAGTVAQINRPGLSAFYRGKVGGNTAIPFEVASSNGPAAY
jgi:UrcA family protein